MERPGPAAELLPWKRDLDRRASIGRANDKARSQRGRDAANDAQAKADSLSLRQRSAQAPARIRAGLIDDVD